MQHSIDTMRDLFGWSEIKVSDGCSDTFLTPIEERMVTSP